MIRAVLLSLLMACTLGMHRADAAKYELALRFVAAVENHDAAALRSLGAVPMSFSLRERARPLRLHHDRPLERRGAGVRPDRKATQPAVPA
jgi:hypothetical protein